MQKLTLIGHLGKDAEIRETANGGKFVSLSIASTDRTKGGAKKTSWYDAVMFSYNDKLVPYLTKGSGVVAVGDIDCDVEVGKDGVARCRRSLTIDSIQFNQTGKTDGNGEQTHSTNSSTSQQQVEMPSMMGSRKQKAEPAVVTATVASSAVNDESDLPF